MKKISAILLAVALMVTGSPVWIFADTETGDANSAAQDWTVEVTEVGATEASVEWYPPEDAEYVHYDDAVFRLTATNVDGDSSVVLKAKPDDEFYDDMVYDYSEETGRYSYDLSDLEPDTEYTVALEYELNEDEDIALGESEAFVTKAVEEAAPAEEPAEEPEEEPEEDAGPEAVIEGDVPVAEPAVPEEAVKSAMKDGEVVEGELVCTGTTYNSAAFAWKLTKDGDLCDYDAGSAVVKVDGVARSDVSISGSAGSYTFTVSGLKPSTQYTVSTTAFVAGHQIDCTAAAKTKADTRPLTVSGLTYSKKGNKYVTLTWQLKKGDEVYTESDVENLAVYRGNSSGKNFKLQSVTIKFNESTYKYTAKVTGLKAGTKYTFKVKEKNSKSTAKKAVKTAAAVADVKNFKALSTYNGVILKWKKVNGATGYTIKWKSGKKSGTIKVKKGKTVKYLHEVPKSLSTKKIKYTIVANKKGVGSSANKTKVTGEVVRTAHITAYLSMNRTLTSHDSAAITHTFPKGYKIDAYGYDGGRYVFDYKGHQFMVKRITTYGSSTSQLDPDLTYSKAEAESFVNRCGLKSATQYLIWVNTYTQSLYVFKGSKGKWKLFKGPWDVCTGKSATPTPTGLTRVRGKDHCPENFPQTPWWCVCAAGFSIHGKAPYYPPMGAPASNGCVRNWSENAHWMHSNIPVMTAVYVF